MTDWTAKLDKKEGSRPRCVLLCDGDKARVARRFTRLVGRPEVEVSAADHWHPRGRCDVDEIQLDKADKAGHTILPANICEQLKDWWLVTPGRTPNWDIASICRISGQKGLLLVEAKAHSREVSPTNRIGAEPPNRCQIRRAISQANAGLRQATGLPWSLSTKHHYQLSNRFAWAWKLASLGVPVVLVYLGFLAADEMQKKGDVFKSRADWEKVLRGYCEGVVPWECWERGISVDGTPLFPLIRVYLQPFSPPGN